MEDLSEQLRALAARRERDGNEARQALRERMGELERQLAAFDAATARIMEQILKPRLQLLTAHFPDASIHTDTHGVCIRFNETRRLPATVTLEFKMYPRDGSQSAAVNLLTGEACLQYRLEILPILMAYEPSDSLSFDLEAPEMADVEAFVERKLVDFMQTYLVLERHPAYQWNELVRDPVCGMTVNPLHAGASCVIGQERKMTYYFCIEACRDRFLAEPGRYVPILASP